MPYQDDIDKCLEHLKASCKKSYAFGGPITTPSGKKKCVQDLKDKGFYGRDRSPACKDDPEACNHTGCAAVSERGNLGELMEEAAPEMKTTIGSLMGRGGKVKKISKTKKMRPPLALKLNPKMKGVFTKKAKKANMSVQKYAQQVIKKYKGKTKNKRELKLLKQAVFAKTAKSWKKTKKSKK